MEKTASCWGGLHQALPLERMYMIRAAKLSISCVEPGKRYVTAARKRLHQAYAIIARKGIPTALSTMARRNSCSLQQCHNSKNVFMKSELLSARIKVLAKGAVVHVEVAAFEKRTAPAGRNACRRVFLELPGKNRGRVFRRACGYGGKPSVFWACGRNAGGRAA